MAVGLAALRKVIASSTARQPAVPSGRAPRSDEAARSTNGQEATRERAAHAPWKSSPIRGQSWGLFGDFQVCPRGFSGTFRRVSREDPDSAERHERAGQGLFSQHSMMFTASPPRAVSLYFTDMSVKVSFMVLMTLLASTYAPALPSRWQARRRQHAFHCSSRRAPGHGRRGCCRRAPRSAGRRPGHGGQPDDRRSAGARGGPGWNWP